MATSSAGSRRIDVNGATLHCETAGAGDAIVLVHSGITDSRMWDAQIEPLTRDHLVVRYDMRGFGRSTIPPEPFAHHDDLFGLFHALDLGPSVLIGASYGGDVAAAFAIEHPELIQALVLVNSLVGMAEPSAGLRDGWRAVNAAMENEDVEHAVELETRMWVDGPRRTPSEVDKELREQVNAMNAAIFARADEQDAAEERELEPPAVERLSEIRVPALVVVGELDQPDAMVSAATLVAGIPHARKVTIPNAGHLPSMERPAQFNRILLDFLADL